MTVLRSIAAALAIAVASTTAAQAAILLYDDRTTDLPDDPVLYLGVLGPGVYSVIGSLTDLAAASPDPGDFFSFDLSSDNLVWTFDMTVDGAWSEDDIFFSVVHSAVDFSDVFLGAGESGTLLGQSPTSVIPPTAALAAFGASLLGPDMGVGNYDVTITIAPPAVPLPAGAVLLLTGALSLAMFRRKH